MTLLQARARLARRWLPGGLFPRAPLRRVLRAALVLGAMTLVLPAASPSAAAPRTGSRAERAALFDYLAKATLERTAFSPYTPADIGAGEATTMAEYVRGKMRKYRDELLAAESDEALFYALTKLSNARWDSHLKVQTVPGGLVPFPPEAADVALHAPIRFKPDYGDAGAMFLFVSDWSKDFARHAKRVPQLGDRLISVNGVGAAAFFERFSPYFGESSRRALWWKMAEQVGARSTRVPARFFDEQGVSFGLESRAGERYEVTLPYLDYEAIEWMGHDDHRTGRPMTRLLLADPSVVRREPQYAINARRYQGFEHVLSGPALDLYVSRPKQVLLIKAHSFHPSIGETLDALLRYARDNGMQRFGVIFDLTRAVGGDLEEYTLQKLQPRPFKSMFGNLRISDITPALARQLKSELGPAPGAARAASALPAQAIAAPDGGGFLRHWLDTDLAAAIEARQAYSNEVQFKNQFLPTSSDGYLYPAREHLSGPMVLFTAPHSCSGADQFAAMFIDNDLGLSIGLPEGGCSNTWEWDEVLTFAGEKQPLAQFSWTVGHSIRPNGEVLEGNSARPRVLVPLTRDNHADYYDRLMRHALRYIEEQRGKALRLPTRLERLTQRGAPP